MSDPRLELVTLTGVDVSRDLAHAKVYYSTLTATAVDDRDVDPRRRRDRAAGGRVAPARRGRPPDAHPPGAAPRRSWSTPASSSGQRIEDILREIHHQRGVDAARVVARATRRTRERRSSGRGGAGPGGRRDPVARGRGRASRATSVPTATRSARCSRCITCCARRASRASRRSPSRSSSRRTTASCPGSSCSRRPTSFPREPEVMVTFDSRLARPARRPRTAGQGRGRAVVIDHHVSNQRYGTINVIDPDAAASGVLVRRLIARARAAADARRGGLPVRRARVRHRPLPVRVDDARRCSSSRASSSCFDLPIPELSRTLFEEHRFAYLQLLAEALAARGARRREAVRVDEGDPGRSRAPRRDASKRSRASSTSCAARARPRSRAC